MDIDEMLIDNAVNDPTRENLSVAILVIHSKEAAAEKLRKRLADGLKGKYPGNTVEEILVHMRESEEEDI